MHTRLVLISPFFNLPETRRQQVRHDNGVRSTAEREGGRHGRGKGRHTRTRSQSRPAGLFNYPCSVSRAHPYREIGFPYGTSRGVVISVISFLFFSTYLYSSTSCPPRVQRREQHPLHSGPTFNPPNRLRVPHAKRRQVYDIVARQGTQWGHDESKLILYPYFVFTH